MKKLKTAAKELNSIALPLIVQNMTGVLIAVTDQAIIGRISLEAFNAVGAVSSLFMLLAGIFGYISVQFNIDGGKASIKNNGDFADEFSSTLILNMIIGLFFFALFLSFSRPLFSIIYGFEGYMLDTAVSYSRIMSVYLFIQLLLFSFGAFFKIKKNTKWILIANLSAAVLNLLLDFILIIGMGFGVQAAAISNVVAKLLSLFIYVCLCRKEIKITLAKFTIYKTKMISTIKSSIPLMGQEILEGGVFSLAMIGIIARIGYYQLTAYLALTLIISFVMMPAYMYGSAILTLVSQIDAKHDKGSYALLPKVGLLLSATIFIGVAVLLFILRNLFLNLITDNNYATSIASFFMIFMIFVRLFEVVGIVYKYSLQVIGHSKFVLYRTATVNLIAVVILLLTTQFFSFGLYGVFVALLLNYCVTSILYILKYRKALSTNLL